MNIFTSVAFLREILQICWQFISTYILAERLLQSAGTLAQSRTEYRPLLRFNLKRRSGRHSCGNIFVPLVDTGCFKKVAHPKTFCNIFTSVKPFCVQFCHFLAIHIRIIATNFCRFILIFHQMVLIFPRIPIFLPCQVLSIHPENENAAFRK